MREIPVVKQILEWNQDVSAEVKETLKRENICMINLMGSPGAGKTHLLLRMLEALRPAYRVGVIEGDIAGQIDAETIRAAGVPCVQLQTQGACHIEAMSIENILPLFRLEELDVLIVENIGNLVCPAEFDIGEDFRIALLSVPEGDDKVIKYPLMFSTCDAIVLHKYDMKPYFDFDDARVARDTLDCNPSAKLFRVSSRTGEGLEDFLAWLRGRIAEKVSR